MDVVRHIEKTPKNPGDKPKEDVIIAAAGHEAVETPFAVHRNDA